MLVTEHFVFLHMPKTGGGSVAQALLTLMPPNYARRGPRPYNHPSWQHIPADSANLPVFCHVRNPWDWYVSWYFFARGRVGTETKLWRSAFGDTPDFALFLNRVCTGQIDHDIPEIAKSLNRGIDLYSARLHHLVGGVDQDHLTCGRFERLFYDLEEFMRRLRAPVPNDFADQATNLPRIHGGEHDSYQVYYNKTTRALVERSCDAIIHRFDYKF